MDLGLAREHCEEMNVTVHSERLIVLILQSSVGSAKGQETLRLALINTFPNSHRSAMQLGRENTCKKHV